MKFHLVKRPSSDALLKSFSNCKKIIYKKDEFLFHKADPIEYLDLLVEGKIQIFKYDANYNEITLNFFTPVSLIAEWAVINEIPYPASGRFIQDSIVHRMPIREFKSKLDEDISLNHIVINSLVRKIDILNMTINRGLTMDSTQKVVHFLYYSPTDLLDLKQNQIASMLCLRPETLSRILKQLKDKDLIDTDKGRITIKNKEELGNHLEE
jgi:CRP/FNR family transcriptional regulator